MSFLSFFKNSSIKFLIILVILFIFSFPFSILFKDNKEKNQKIILSESSLKKKSEEKKKEKDFYHQETGLFFKYPLEWQDFFFDLSASFGQNSLHWEGYGGKEDNPFERPFRFLLYSKDYFPFNLAQFAFNATSVKQEWNLAEFSKKMGFPQERIFFIQKIGKKSLLVAFNDDIVLGLFEAFPRLGLAILTPFTQEYPNLEIRIYYDFYQDPIFKKSFSDLNPEEKYKLFFSLLSEIASKVEKKEYSQKVNQLLEIGRAIADSVEKL
ncbi:MAG: hypothetical protein ACPLZH_00655 [Minisyncoccales bacterium]